MTDEEHFEALKALIQLAHDDPKGVRAWLDEQERQERRARVAIAVCAVAVVVGSIGLAVYIGLVLAGLL